jgi:hypothetical protein
MLKTQSVEEQIQFFARLSHGLTIMGRAATAGELSAVNELQYGISQQILALAGGRVNARLTSDESLAELKNSAASMEIDRLFAAALRFIDTAARFPDLEMFSGGMKKPRITQDGGE